MQESHASIRLFLWPRRTMRWILNHDPNYGVMMIAMLAGITAALRSSAIHGMHPLPELMGFNSLLNEVITYGIGPSASMPLTLATIGIYGALMGVVLVTFGSLLLMAVGWIFGGSGRFSEVRAALTWAFVPYSWLLPIWGVYVVVEWNTLRHMSYSFGTLLPWNLSGDLAAMLAIDYAFRIFCLVWLVLKLSVALRITVWRAVLVVAVVFLPVAVLLVPWQGFGF